MRKLWKRNNGTVFRCALLSLEETFINISRKDVLLIYNSKANIKYLNVSLEKSPMENSSNSTNDPKFDEWQIISGLFALICLINFRWKKCSACTVVCFCKVIASCFSMCRFGWKRTPVSGIANKFMLEHTFIMHQRCTLMKKSQFYIVWRTCR